MLTGEDEIREAYYAFSHLGCDEQLWDFEGKEVEEFVVEKLLSQYEAFFREQPLGERVFLTPRVPNPALERSQDKVLLEVLHSIPRHSDVARMLYGREREPIVELIFPMTTSAAELERVRSYYRARVSALAEDPALRSWFGEFRPAEIAASRWWRIARHCWEQTGSSTSTSAKPNSPASACSSRARIPL